MLSVVRTIKQPRQSRLGFALCLYAVEWSAVFDSGRSSAAMFRRYSLCRPAIIGMICEGDRANLGNKRYSAAAGHRRCRWLAYRTVESSAVRHWHLTASRSSSSGRPLVRQRLITLTHPLRRQAEFKIKEKPAMVRAGLKGVHEEQGLP